MAKSERARKPRFRVGMVVFCKQCKRYSVILSLGENRAIITDCPKSGGPAQVRPLTKTERGEGGRRGK